MIGSSQWNGPIISQITHYVYFLLSVTIGSVHSLLDFSRFSLTSFGNTVQISYIIETLLASVHL